MLSNTSIKVVEFKTDENFIGDSKILIPATQMMEIEANRLSKRGWRLVMMDALSLDFIIAVFERTQVEIDIDD